ncbi:DUF4175 domain-containing protein [Paracoccus sediminilitoris]|uniref:DUF4175 domain-containing protein n=1 Tax=Paracoccus sediminilitoris TaxID=2202419 RepID=UPI001F3DCDF9|nr:DUF4175 family protein [Paracoccus sediminilitoris]
MALTGRQHETETPGASRPRTTDDLSAGLSRSVARALALTRWGMIWERVIAAFWPLAVLLAVGFAALAFGVAQVMPAILLPWVAGLWLLAVIGAAILGGVRLRRVRPAEALLRLDRTLPGRPLSALADRAAIGGEGALWDAHIRQMRQAAQAARPVRPDAGLARRDPLALRLAALVALVMALIFGGIGQVGQGIGAIAATVAPRMMPQSAADTGPAWEGWAEPPAYTRRPTIYLNALQGDALELPKGSLVQVRLYGDDKTVEQDIGALQGDDPQEMVIRAEQSGHVQILDRRFAITVLPDLAPRITPGEAAARRADGRMMQDFTASDDHGLADAEAVITLDMAQLDRRFGLAADPDPRDPIRLNLPLPSRDRKDVQGRLVEDLSRHPWANLPVSLTLRATDGIQQVGQSDPRATVLPGRRFFNPLAAALIEMRRDLLWAKANAPRSAEILRALTWQPEGFVEGELYRELRASVALLEGPDFESDARDRLAEALWDAAVQLEDGGLSDALQAMRDAQEKLSEAIRNGASPDEIQQLMDQLREATDDYTRMLAEQSEAPQADSPDQGQEQGQEITGDQIQQMMEEIQRLMNEGRMAEAEQLLEQFNRMMENLQVRQSRGQQGQQGEGSQGSQPMNRLADTLRDQQQLSDEAFREAQRQFRDGQQGETGDLADRQQALREDLDQQRGLLPGQGSERGDQARDRLDDAGRAMEDAEQALREGDTGRAMQRQADAIQSMREGMQSMGDMLAEQGQQGQRGQDGQEGQTGGADGSGQASGNPGTDPLGRQQPTGTNQITGDSEGGLGTNPAARARDLLDEIRRRMGDPGRSASELDYLDRLGDQF